MQITLLKGKIHRCTVTHADVGYEGSVTISAELMEAAGIVEHEQVHVWNVTNAERITTYAMRGPRESGVICINGAAAKLVKPGDVVIIAAFIGASAAEAGAWKPSVVFVDSKNRITSTVMRESPGPES